MDNPSQDSPVDLEWLLQSERTDRHALIAPLVAAHYPDLHRLALAFLEDANLAEEAVKETLASAALNVHRYPSGGRPLVWLLRLAVPICRRMDRQERWQRLFEESSPEDEPLSPAAGEADGGDPLPEVVGSLPASLRLPLLLHDLLDLTLFEVAWVLRNSERPVESRLDRARKRVALALAREAVNAAREALPDRPSAGALQARWPRQDLTADQLSRLAEATKVRISRQQRLERFSVSFKEIALAAVIVALAGLVVWFQDRGAAESPAAPAMEGPVQMVMDGHATLTPAELEMTAGIRAAFGQEMLAWRSGDVSLYQALMDPEAGEAWRIGQTEEFRFALGEVEVGFPTVESTLLVARPYQPSLQAVDWRADLALAEILLDDPAGEFFDRTVLRFYRQVNGVWLRTAPLETFWGESQSLETAHLRLAFYERDAAAVRAVAARADTRYKELSAALGLSLPNRPLEVQLALTASLDGPEQGIAGGPLISPALSSPAYLNAEQVMLRALGEHLARTAVDSALGRSAPGSGIQPAQLQPEARELATGVTAWWVRQWVPLPEAVEDERRWWLFAGRSPSEISLAQRLGPLGQVDLQAAETLATYITFAYGEDRFGPMLHALTQGKPWEETLAITLGVERTEFEAGWQRFILENYLSVSQPQPSTRPLPPGILITIPQVVRPTATGRPSETETQTTPVIPSSTPGPGTPVPPTPAPTQTAPPVYPPPATTAPVPPTQPAYP